MADWTRDPDSSYGRGGALLIGGLLSGVRPTVARACAEFAAESLASGDGEFPPGRTRRNSSAKRRPSLRNACPIAGIADPEGSGSRRYRRRYREVGQPRRHRGARGRRCAAAAPVLFTAPVAADASVWTSSCGRPMSRRRPRRWRAGPSSSSASASIPRPATTIPPSCSRRAARTARASRWARRSSTETKSPARRPPIATGRGWVVTVEFGGAPRRNGRLTPRRTLVSKWRTSLTRVW